MFIKNKYTKCYYSIINAAKVRVSTRKEAKKVLQSYEQHHIIPESFFTNRTRKGTPGWLPGNPNEKENLVFLTSREHFICHLLLLKMCSGQGLRLMEYAFSAMCSWKSKKNTRLEVKSRWYELSKLLKKERGVSNETRSKISLANRGKPKTEETKRKISSSKQGFKHSDETRAKMCEAQRHRSKEVLSKLAEQCKSPERRALSSKVHKGKTVSSETREKIRNNRIQWTSTHGEKWVLQTPNKEIIEIRGLNAFCKEHNLCPMAFNYNLTASTRNPISRGRSAGWMAISRENMEK